MRDFKKGEFQSKSLKVLILQLPQAINVKLSTDIYRVLTDLHF